MLISGTRKTVSMITDKYHRAIGTQYVALDVAHIKTFLPMYPHTIIDIDKYSWARLPAQSHHLSRLTRDVCIPGDYRSFVQTTVQIIRAPKSICPICPRTVLGTPVTRDPADPPASDDQGTVTRGGGAEGR